MKRLYAVADRNKGGKIVADSYRQTKVEAKAVRDSLNDPLPEDVCPDIARQYYVTKGPDHPKV